MERELFRDHLWASAWTLLICRCAMLLKREHSLRQYLMAFGAALLLPILGLAAISVREFARAEKQQNEQRAQAAAEHIIADIDQELARLQAAGQALASSAALRAGNYERFQQRATEVTRALPRSEYEIVVRAISRVSRWSTRMCLGERRCRRVRWPRSTSR